MAEARTALWVIQQAMVEMGLGKPTEAATSQDLIVQQMVALFNRVGSEFVLGYPWEQLLKEFIIETQENVSSYALPSDWSYFLDQTQWDRTNHWPLMGPKTSQEWQWLKGGLLSSGPRLRYRIWGGKFEIFPTPSPSNTPSADNTGVFTPWTLAMEYVSQNWLKNANVEYEYYPELHSDTDIVLFDPWVMSSYLKLKYYEAKGLDTAAFSKDFLSIWESRIGKNKGAPLLTLAPRYRSILIGPNSVPDGSWAVYGGATAP